MRRLFGTNGVRFILGKTMSISDILRLGLAIGTFFKGKKCLMGRDVRLTGEAVASAISSGLMSTGCTVYDVGLITTPALQYLVRRLGFDFGVMITASHNPPEFNGVKVMDSDGVEIPREKEVVIEDIYFRNKFEYANWDKVGDYKVLQGVLDYYIEGVLEHAKIDEITERRFTVVVDPANSVPVFTTPEVLKRLNCRVMTINANLDGDFPGREPEPRPDTLRELAEAVKTAGADLGVGHDGDGDRAIFVDEEGTVHWGDRTGALIVKFFMEEHPGEKIVTPVSTSKVVEDVVKK
ncbi:MAG: phosphoglucosamine mutase, partial [Thermoprotei archaeon]